LIGAAQRGAGALAINLGAAALIGLAAWGMIRFTGNLPQWLAVGIGFYAVFSWAGTLRARDPATYRLIWGTPAFLCVTIGYGLIALNAYANAFWGAPYAEVVLGLPKKELAFYLGATGALSGFVGVILGGRIADMLRARNPAGRIIVIIFGAVAPVLPTYIGFNTSSGALFYSMNFVAGLCLASALGAAAATTQDLVLPRMRGTATAAFFLGTTLVGLAFGPYLVGLISDLNATMVDGQKIGDLRTGILTVMFATVPISFLLLLFAYRSTPAAEATLVARASAAEADQQAS
jgi:MFS family permease